MSEIDWDQAPEGATHWEPDTGRAVPGWMKLEKGNWFYWPIKTNSPSWHFSGELTEPRVISMIPRPSPACSGEGLPPVGSDCEFSHQGTGGEWIKCHVVGYHLGHLYGYCPENEWFMEKHDGACHLFIDASVKFRPIRTTEQIAADEREAAIRAIVYDLQDAENLSSLPSIANCLYGKGYRKP